MEVPLYYRYIIIIGEEVWFSRTGNFTKDISSTAVTMTQSDISLQIATKPIYLHMHSNTLINNNGVLITYMYTLVNTK